MRFALISLVGVLSLFLSTPFNSSALELEKKTQKQRYEEAIRLINENLASFAIEKSESNLVLLGTIGSEDSDYKAIIKNTETGKLKIYSRGQSVNLVDEKLKVVDVSTCKAVLERRGSYEVLECDVAPSSQITKMPSPLSGFIISELDTEKRVILKGIDSRYEDEIVVVSERYGVDPNLVKAVIKVESNFNPRAVSPKNAIGIMQLIPATANDYGVDDPFDPHENIDGGVRYLRDLIEVFNGDLELVLSAYNAGVSAVIKYGYSIPPYSETKEYVKKVLAYYNDLKY
ncbi:MAG: lytic transglycosylase domain-containing protein [Thermodesulfobacteriota bacterium]